MGNGIMDSPATNEEPLCVIFWNISTFFKQNQTQDINMQLLRRFYDFVQNGRL